MSLASYLFKTELITLHGNLNTLGGTEFNSLVDSSADSPVETGDAMK